MGNATSTAAHAPARTLAAAPSLPRFWDLRAPADWGPDEARRLIPLMGADGIGRLGPAQLENLAADDIRALDGAQLDALFDVAEPALLRRFPVDVLPRVKPCLVEFRFAELCDEQRSYLIENLPLLCPPSSAASTSRPGCLACDAAGLHDKSQLADVVKNRGQLRYLQRTGVFSSYRWYTMGEGAQAKLFVRSAGISEHEKAACEAFLEIRLAPAGGGIGTALPARAMNSSQWLSIRVDPDIAGRRHHTLRFRANVAGTDRVGRIPDAASAVTVADAGDFAVPGTAAFIENGEQRRHFIHVFPGYSWKRAGDALYVRPKGLGGSDWLKVVRADALASGAMDATRLPPRAVGRAKDDWAVGPSCGPAAALANRCHRYGADGVIKPVDDANRPVYRNGMGPDSPGSYSRGLGLGPFTRLLDHSGIAILATDGVSDLHMHLCAAIVADVLRNNAEMAQKLSAQQLVVHLTESTCPTRPGRRGDYVPQENTIRIYRAGWGADGLLVWGRTIAHELAHAVYEWLPEETRQRATRLPPVVVDAAERDGWRHPVNVVHANMTAAEDFAFYYASWWREAEPLLPGGTAEELLRTQPERAQLYRELFG
jgi:hypothetical protein